MKQPLHIGLVGANPNQSWAMLSHLPAIKVLPDVELVAVATSRPETARAAGAAFGVDEFYSSAAELAQSEDVDIVSVVVKVPYHAQIVEAALNAGKHVLCEWPLARSVEEAQTLVERAAKSDVHVAVGLQSRQNPAARRAQELITSGALGRLLTATIVSNTSGFGPQIPGAYAYFDDPDTGANTSTIAGGHTLDLAIFLLGGIAELAAMSSIKFPQIEITDAPDEAPITRTLADHLAITARMGNGCALSVTVDAGRPADAPFSCHVVGTKGELTLTGGSPFGFQGGELALQSTVDFAAPDATTAPELTGPLLNVGELYERFALDIENGEHQTPDFVHALKLQKLIRSVGVAAASGARQMPDDWPTN